MNIRTNLFIVMVLMYPPLVLSNPIQNFWKCAIEVEKITGIDQNVIAAIKIAESGTRFDSVLNHNSNGSVDIGIMQTNSIWFTELARYGIHREMLHDNCVSVKVAAWMLLGHLKKTDDLWEAVGRYHSKTPKFKIPYQNKVKKIYEYLERNG